MSVFFWTCCVICGFWVISTILLILTLFVLNILGQPVLTAVNVRLNSPRFLSMLRALSIGAYIRVICWAVLTFPIADLLLLQVSSRFKFGKYFAHTYFGDFTSSQFIWYIVFVVGSTFGGNGAVLVRDTLRSLRDGRVALRCGRWLPNLEVNLLG